MLRGDWSPRVTLLYYMYEERDRKFMGKVAIIMERKTAAFLCLVDCATLRIP